MLIKSLVLSLVTAGVLTAGIRTTSAGPSVSVTVRSSCSSTVKVKYDSTIASLDPNEVDSRSLDVGDKIAVLDESEHELDSLTVSESTRDVQIGCSSVSAR